MNKRIFDLYLCIIIAELVLIRPPKVFLSNFWGSYQTFALFVYIFALCSVLLVISTECVKSLSRLRSVGMTLVLVFVKQPSPRMFISVLCFLYSVLIVAVFVIGLYQFTIILQRYELIIYVAKSFKKNLKTQGVKIAWVIVGVRN